MKVSFTIKFGILLTAMILSMVGYLMSGFIAEIRLSQRIDMEILGTHMINAGAYIFDEEAREDVAAVRIEVLQAITDEHPELADEVRNSSMLSYGSMPVLDASSATRIRKDMSFRSTVQLLRRVKAASTDAADRLDVIGGSEEVASCSAPNTLTDSGESVSEGFVWTYLIGELPNVDPRDAVVIFANSNSPNKGIDSTIDSARWSLFRAPIEVAEIFVNGGLALTDWYESPFDRCSSVMTVAVPLRDERGDIVAVLGADYSVAHLEARLAEMRSDYAALFVTSLVAVVAIVLILLTWISVPLARLSEGAVQLEKGNYDFKIRLVQKDEFGFLAKTLNRVSESLSKFSNNMEAEVAKRTKNLVDAQQKIEELNALLAQDSAYLNADVAALNSLRSHAIDGALGSLAHESQRIGSVTLEYSNSLSKVAGGHFASGLKHDGPAIGLGMGDVAGNGIETVSLALQIQAILGSSTFLDQAAQLSSINAYLCSQSLEVGALAEMILISLDENQLSITGSGATVILASAAGECRYISLGLPLGVDEDASWESSSFSLDGGSVIVMNGAFRSALLKYLGEKSQDISAESLFGLAGFADKTTSELMAQVNAHNDSAERHEDLSLLVIRSS